MVVSGSAPRRTNILIVDDHAVVRAGLKMLIESTPGLAVIGEAHDRASALAEAARSLPDIILLDLDLGAESGIDLIADLIAAVDGTRILVLTGIRDPEMHLRAIRLGAKGVVLKETAAGVLVK